jgi:hypothetical protein
MMNSNDVIAGTVTLKTLESTGWEEDDEQDEEIPADYRKSIGKADGLLNTANEVPRGWDHSNMWKGDDGREREVRGHSRASATIDFTDVHGFAL